MKGYGLITEQFRTAIAAGCILGGVAIHYSGSIVFTLGVLIWLLLAMGAGYMRPTAWLLLAAPLPWLIGVGAGVLTGRHDALGDVWLLPFLLSTVAGLIGIVFGVAARRGRSATDSDRGD
jgi:hypothetical protein